MSNGTFRQTETFSKQLLLAVAIALFAAPASAATTVVATYSGGLSGWFDLSNSLTQGLEFDSGTAVFHFADTSIDTQNGSTTNTTATSVGFNTTTLITFVNPLDSAIVNLAGQSATGSNVSGFAASSTSSTTGRNYSYIASYGTETYVSGVNTYTYSCGFLRTCTGQSPIYSTRTYPIYATGTDNTIVISNRSGYYGHFDVQISLAPLTRSYITSGQLPFSFSVSSGSANLISAEINYNSIQAVPEPGEWAMMLAGLGTAGLIARRRKQS